mgnify:CR=1 FL=1
MNNLIIGRERMQEFEENLWLCERTEELIRAIEKSRKGTQIYRDITWNAEEKLSGILYNEMNIREDGMMEDVIERMNGKRSMGKRDRRIGVACFVSACYPGGNSIRGCSGSEELLCRQSTLYPCLNSDYLRRNYYEVNENCEIDLTVKYIYVPDVVCTVYDRCEDIWMEGCCDSFDVICCARTEGTMKEDMESMLMIAGQQGIDEVIFLLDERDIQ